MADEKSTALVPHEGEPQLPTLVAQPLSANDLLVRAQERAGLINLTRYAIACTRESHWVDFDGSPYFTSDAAEWVAERVGINYRPIRRERYEGWDDAGPYYGWEYDVEAWFEGTSDRIVEVGECTSRDKLYGKKGGKFRPLHEIDEANIKRKAYVNGVARVVRARLGIGGLTWKEVKALIGKSIDPAASVSFKTDDKKASEKKTSDEAKSRPRRRSGGANKMGRNYYHHTNPCPACGHCEIRHIGKSSIGWMFVFHGYPDDGIKSYADWLRVLKSNGKIVDEYDREMQFDDLKKLIEAKRTHADHAKEYPGDTTWTDKDGHPFNGHDFC